MKLSEVSKAVVAGLIAFVGQFDVARVDGIEGEEWVLLVALTLLSAFAVWAIPNTSPVVPPAEPPVERPYYSYEPGAPRVEQT